MKLISTNKFLAGTAILALVFASTFCVRVDPKERMLREGAFLADKYCITCHLTPAPGELPKKAWLEILPKMGAWMGMETTLNEMNYAYTLKDAKVFPAKPLMSPEEWARIKDYYIALSPDSLKYEASVIADENSILFKASKISFKDTPPQTGAVTFLGDHSVAFGNILNGDLGFYDLQSDQPDKVQMESVPVHFEINGDTTKVLLMGNFAPNNLTDGRLVQLVGKKVTDTLVSDLVRPVHASYDDLNRDGKEDIVISSFGYQVGSLDWFENTANGYVKHTLKSTAGAVKTHIEDLNNDGFLDILALFAQGDEGFDLFLGDGNGGFTRKELLRFPSTYGSSYFDYVDLDSDGIKEILYVNGDNADFSSPVLKPYHGVRILKSSSSNGIIEFKEVFFYPLNGGYKAIPADYDLDGDLDIAFISHFPDYNRTAEESFLILENQDKDSFGYIAKPIAESFEGKWMTMDAADYDNDGDIDLILGNSPLLSLNDPKEFQSLWSKELTNLMLLENTTIQ